MDALAPIYVKVLLHLRLPNPGPPVMRATSILKLLCATAAIVLCATPHVGAAEKKTLGFAVTKWNTAVYEGKFMDECPEGLNPSNKDIWWSKLNWEQRRKTPDILATQRSPWNFRGEHGEDVCVAPTSVKDPPLRIVKGGVSFGMNLDGNTDGAATAKTCKHENFTGVDGTAGVDNQMYRLFGCVYAWRSNGHIEQNANSHRLSSGLGMILIEISDVDDMRNDDHVDVTFYRGLDPFATDSAGHVLPFSSYRIDMENGKPRYGDKVAGKIVDGAIVTETGNVHLPFFGNYQYMNQEIRDLRLKLSIAPDGKTAKGDVGGYYSVEQIYRYVSGMLGAFPNTTQFSCPGIYVAAHELADGYPDAKTGECTMLSSAFKLEAVAAFINHPEAKPSQQAAR